jgi:hypothetical protein
MTNVIAAATAILPIQFVIAFPPLACALAMCKARAKRSALKTKVLERENQQNGRIKPTTPWQQGHTFRGRSKAAQPQKGHAYPPSAAKRMPRSQLASPKCVIAVEAEVTYF